MENKKKKIAFCRNMQKAMKNIRGGEMLLDNLLGCSGYT